MPVPTIWLSAPSSSHGQNAAVGHGSGSPVTTITTRKKTIENGKPNRKRILVAPQVPSGPVNDRCIALRATWPSAAMMVKGIQREATESMGNTDGKMPHRAGRNRSGQREPRHDRIARHKRAVVPGNAGTHAPRLLNQIPLIDGFRNNEHMWLWVPAFAGTTPVMRQKRIS